MVLDSEGPATPGLTSPPHSFFPRGRDEKRTGGGNEEDGDEGKQQLLCKK